MRTEDLIVNCLNHIFFINRITTEGDNWYVKIYIEIVVQYV